MIDLEQVLTGIFTAITIGFGTAIGNWIAARHLINRIEEKQKGLVEKNGKTKQ